MVAIIILLLLFVGNVKGEETEMQGEILVASIQHEPELWLIHGKSFYHFPDVETRIKASKLQSTWDIEELSNLKIYIGNPSSIKVTEPYTYHFSPSQQIKIWKEYKKFADSYIKKIMKKDISEQNKHTSPILAVPTEAKVSKDGLIEIKTDPKKVIEREQNDNKGFVLGVVLFILVIEAAFIISLFVSKDFRKSVFKDVG